MYHVFTHRLTHRRTGNLYPITAPSRNASTCVGILRVEIATITSRLATISVSTSDIVSSSTTSAVHSISNCRQQTSNLRHVSNEARSRAADAVQYKSRRLSTQGGDVSPTLTDNALQAGLSKVRNDGLSFAGWEAQSTEMSNILQRDHEKYSRQSAKHG